MPRTPDNLIEEPILLLHMAKSIQLLSLRLHRLLMSEEQKVASEAKELARSQDRVVEKYLQAKRRLN